MDNAGRLFFTLFVAVVSLRIFHGKTAVTAQKCWQCTSEVRPVTDAAKQAPCAAGLFPAQDIHQMDCPEGECITYTSVIPDELPFMTRGCLTARKQQKKMCAGGKGIKDVSCCKGNLCNAGDGLAVKFATLVLITSSALATMFKIFN